MLGCLTFAPLRHAGLLYQLGGLIALLPSIDPLNTLALLLHKHARLCAFVLDKCKLAPVEKWQAYEQDDLEAVIDLGTTQPVQEVSARFFRNIGAWIFLPVHLEVALSQDGAAYDVMGTLATPAATETDSTEVKVMPLRFAPRQARYVRLRAQSQGVCPSWHSGAGGKAWLFVDEIRVR